MKKGRWGIQNLRGGVAPRHRDRASVIDVTPVSCLKL